MKKTDNDPKRLGEHPEMHRLDSHPEAQRLEGHPQPESLPAHEEDATPIMAPLSGKVPATTDAQETVGIARGAGWIALAILALMVVAACLWPRRASFQTQDSATYSSARGYPLRLGTVIAAIPTAVNTVVPDSAIQLATTVAGTTQPDAVVIYLFNTDSSAIPENSSLTAVAQAAHKTGKTVVVKAYTDETGRAAYNQRLSERRAKSVGDYMVAHGVPANHVKAKGYGPTHAYANNSQDRRAEITLE